MAFVLVDTVCSGRGRFYAQIFENELERGTYVSRYYVSASRSERGHSVHIGDLAKVRRDVDDELDQMDREL